MGADGCPVSCAINCCPLRVTVTTARSPALYDPTYPSNTLASTCTSTCVELTPPAALGGLTWAATATNATENASSAIADARHHFAGLLSMIMILRSRNDLDSDIAATAPM